ETQLQQMEEVVIAKGWTVAHVYCDKAYGRKERQPAFQRMCSDIEKRAFDLLFFWSLHRLSPEGAQAALPVLERLLSKGIGFRSFQEEHFDSHKILQAHLPRILAKV